MLWITGSFGETFPGDPSTVELILSGKKWVTVSKGVFEKTNRVDEHFDVRLCLTSHESLPGFVSLVDDLGRVLLVLGFTGEGKLVLGLACRGKRNPYQMPCSSRYG
jgi:hypothetical protein